MTYAYRNAGAWGAGNGAGAGGKLTSTQADNNIYQLVTAIADIVAAGAAIGIDVDNPVTITGDQLTFHFSDSSTKTITIPTATPIWRGDYAAVSYAVNDWFNASGTIFRVNVAHTGSVPFDPGAADTASGDYYTKLMDLNATPGREVSDATFTPTTSDANKWIVLTNPVGGCAVSIDPGTAFGDWTALFFRDQTSGGATFEIATGGTINSQFNCANQSAGPGSTITLKKTRGHGRLGYFRSIDLRIYSLIRDDWLQI